MTVSPQGMLLECLRSKGSSGGRGLYSHAAVLSHDKSRVHEQSRMLDMACALFRSQNVYPQASTQPHCLAFGPGLA